MRFDHVIKINQRDGHFGRRGTVVPFEGGYRRGPKMFTQIKRNGFVRLHRSPNTHTIHDLDALDPVETMGFADDRDQIGVRLYGKHLTWVSCYLRRAGRNHAHTCAQLKHTVARPHEFAQQLDLRRLIAVASDHMRHSI